jgi:APA family basic amino acid/polyamine antiporter
MLERKLGPVLLTGFIIGPILGSGIIILPPLVHGLLGAWALPAWVVMVVIGALFAAVFGSMSILFPGDSGVSECVARAFGPRAKTLTALFLIGAVCFGPVAVALTAAKYLGLGRVVPDVAVGAGLVGVIWVLLLRRITSLGRVAFVLSTGAAILLLTGGLGCLVSGAAVPLPVEPMAPMRFGYGLLVLFWTVVGWEIIGNYSAEIHDPGRTIPRSVALSVVVIASVTLIVAAAMQSVGGETLTGILVPVFGQGSAVLLSVLAVALCLVTELAFTGAVARLVAALASEAVLPRWLAVRNRGGAPAMAATMLSLVHLAVLGLVVAGVLGVEKLVAMADGFFLANAITALMAGTRVLESRLLRGLAGVLAVVLVGILAMSSWPVLAVLAGMTLWIFRGKQTMVSGICGGER